MDFIDFTQNSFSSSSSLNNISDHMTTYSPNHLVIRTNPNLKHGKSYNSLFPKEIWYDEGSDENEFYNSPIKNRRIPLSTSDDDDTQENEEYVEWSVKLSTSVDKTNSDLNTKGLYEREIEQKQTVNLLSFDNDNTNESDNKLLSKKDDLLLIDFEKSTAEKITFDEEIDLITGTDNSRTQIHLNTSNSSFDKNNLLIFDNELFMKVMRLIITIY